MTPDAPRTEARILAATEGPRVRCSKCGSELLGRGWLEHFEDGSHAFYPAAADSGVGPHPDASNKDRNHYDWFMPSNPTAEVDAYIDEFEAKCIEGLTDPFMHDMSQVVLPLIAAYRKCRDATPADSLDALRECEKERAGLVAALQADSLDALRALSDAATPGPWELGTKRIAGISAPSVDGYHTVASHKPDAALIVAAVNYVRDCLIARKEME
jgi:hypothetical protein